MLLPFSRLQISLLGIESFFTVAPPFTVLRNKLLSIIATAFFVPLSVFWTRFKADQRHSFAPCHLHYEIHGYSAAPFTITATQHIVLNFSDLYHSKNFHLLQKRAQTDFGQLVDYQGYIQQSSFCLKLVKTPRFVRHEIKKRITKEHEIFWRTRTLILFSCLPSAGPYERTIRGLS